MTPGASPGMFAVEYCETTGLNPPPWGTPPPPATGEAFYTLDNRLLDGQAHGGPFPFTIEERLDVIGFDLAVSKSATPDPAVAGSTLTYEVLVTSDSDRAEDATLADRPDPQTTVIPNGQARLPNGMLAPTQTDSRWDCPGRNPVDPPPLFADHRNDAVCSANVTILPNSSERLLLVVAVDQDATGMLQNIARIDSVVGADEFILDTPVAVLAVQLDKDDGGVSVAPGATVTYTLTVSNPNPDPILGVILRDAVPDFTRFNAAASDPGWTCGAGLPGDVCQNPVGEIAAGDSVSTEITFTVDIDVPTQVTEIVNRASTNLQFNADSTTGFVEERTPITRAGAPRAFPDFNPSTRPLQLFDTSGREPFGLTGCPPDILGQLDLSRLDPAGSLCGTEGAAGSMWQTLETGNDTLALAPFTPEGQANVLNMSPAPNGFRPAEFNYDPTVEDVDNSPFDAPLVDVEIFFTGLERRAPGVQAAQIQDGFLPLPILLTRNLPPIDGDPAGLQFFRLDGENWVPLPTTVNLATGAASAVIDREAIYGLFIGDVRDIPLPAGTAALGFHGAPGTPPDLLQGQLEDPGAFDAIFQFQNGAWLSFRPGALAILNSLTSIDANAPLFLVLSRATRWAGPINPSGDRDVPIASGFTSFTYTSGGGLPPAALVALFDSPGVVTVLFAFDNALNDDRGGYRTFRTAGPDFLNDLEALAPFDILFVLAESATSLSLPDG